MAVSTGGQPYKSAWGMSLQGSLVRGGIIWQGEGLHLELFVRQHHKRVRAGVSDYVGIPYLNLETTSRLKNKKS